MDEISINDLGGFLRDAGGAYAAVTNKTLAGATPAQATPSSGSAVTTPATASTSMSNKWMWIGLGVVVVALVFWIIKRK